jgi:hypothetical protein
MGKHWGLLRKTRVFPRPRIAPQVAPVTYSTCTVFAGSNRNVWNTLQEEIN